MNALAWGLSLLLLSGAGGGSGDRVKVAAPAWRALGLDERAAGHFADYFAQQLALQRDFSVLMQTELTARLGFDRLAQLRCTEASLGCLTELGSALGVRAVVTGSVSRLGGGYTFDVRLQSVQGRTLAFASGRAVNDGHLRDQLRQAAWQVAQDASRTLRAEEAFAPPPPPSR